MLKDLLYLASFYLKLDDISEYLSAIDSGEEATAPSDLAELVTIANIVMRAVSREFSPLYYEQTFTSNENCQIPFSEFNKPINQIKSVSFADGISSTFRSFPDYIKVGLPRTNYSVTYSYYPNEISALEDALTLPMGVSAETIAYGMCAEYLTIEMLYDEADMFEEKFKEGLRNASVSKSERKIANRGWI